MGQLLDALANHGLSVSKRKVRDLIARGVIEPAQRVASSSRGAAYRYPVAALQAIFAWESARRDGAPRATSEHLLQRWLQTGELPARTTACDLAVNAVLEVQRVIEQHPIGGRLLYYARNPASRDEELDDAYNLLDACEDLLSSNMPLEQVVSLTLGPVVIAGYESEGEDDLALARQAPRDNSKDGFGDPEFPRIIAFVVKKLFDYLTMTQSELVNRFDSASFEKSRRWLGEGLSLLQLCLPKTVEKFEGSFTKFAPVFAFVAPEFTSSALRRCLESQPKTLASRYDRAPIAHPRR